jgi:hypothetical protein
MDWDDRTRQRLETALNESEVMGVRLADDGRAVDVLLHVLTLPPDGPIDPDARRVLRLTDPSELRFVLRPDPFTEFDIALPLAGMDAVETFFASLSWGGSMYGWQFFDNPTLMADWPAAASLTIALQPEPAAHTFYWFNECGTDAGAFCIEGTVAFDDLRVFRADGREERIQECIADGERTWVALRTHDDRMSPDAQVAARRGTPTWRDWAREEEE